MNKDKEKKYDPTEALQFVFNQWVKNIYVSIPGIIEEYNPVTKRCKVTPAINILMTDGTTEGQASIINVHVLWPSGGGFTLLSPLPVGSPVEIKFSQRGITKFKETFAQEDPGNGIFEKEDAHVIPGYGALSVTPATEIGICLQKEDGSSYIFIDENDNIETNAATKINNIAPDIESTATVKIKKTSPAIEEISSATREETAPVSTEICATSKTITTPAFTVVSQAIVLGASGGSPLPLLNGNAATVYNGHTHLLPGTGTTNPPNQQMGGADQTVNVTGS